MFENLDRLKKEIETYLSDNSFIIFRGQTRTLDEAQIVYWDTEHYPNYLDFIRTAEAAGIRFVVMQTEIFDEETIAELESGLEGLDMPRDERRKFAKRIEKFGAYTGMVSSIELSYVFDHQIYLYSAQALWYHDYEDLYEELMLSGTDLDDGDDPDNSGGSMGGYFSKN
ncbi:hypothetical protein F183_A46760 [Bryobacterales bacterium F-183]|nr:hypothetical protein F183_A46760 [Bryobacterales bacterium F-183]